MDETHIEEIKELMWKFVEYANSMSVILTSPQWNESFTETSLKPITRTRVQNLIHDFAYENERRLNERDTLQT